MYIDRVISVVYCMATEVLYIDQVIELFYIDRVTNVVY